MSAALTLKERFITDFSIGYSLGISLLEESGVTCSSLGDPVSVALLAIDYLLFLIYLGFIVLAFLRVGCAYLTSGDLGP